MLQKLSDRVSECLLQAEECTFKAEAAFTDTAREEFFSLARSWRMLAESYEFADRPVDFTKENKSRQAENFYFGPGSQ